MYGWRVIRGTVICCTWFASLAEKDYLSCCGPHCKVSVTGLLSSPAPTDTIQINCKLPACDRKKLAILNVKQTADFFLYRDVWRSVDAP
jgi:hypothetical protein